MNTKILIVDDEPAIGKLLVYQLQSYQYQASYTADGLSALEQLERNQPDLILLDVMMPMISGWEVCRQIRACSSVPIIMLTAKSSEADVVTGLTAGADDYIAKPFSMAQLHARIEAVLRRARSESRPRLAILKEVNAPPELISTPALGSTVMSAPPRPSTSSTPPARTTPRATRVVPQTASTPPVAVPQTPVAAAIEHTPLIPQSNHLGPQLRELRLTRGITLVQAARACNTRWEFLQAIEQENYSYVPRSQLRSALQSYSAFLGVAIDLNQPRPITPRSGPGMLQVVTVITIVLLVVAVSVYLL